jgi:hypothetical protein
MTYATAAMVKYRCGIDIIDTGIDTEITSAITSGDTFVDSILSAEGLSTGGTDQALKEASACYAAYVIQKSRNPELAESWKAEAWEHMGLYIKYKKYQGVQARTRGPPFTKLPDE